MRLVVQLSAPGVQHAEQPGRFGAEEPWIGGQRLDRPGRGLEQRLIADALMRAKECAQTLRHGEGEHEVMPGQLALELTLQPGLCLVMLAARAVSVAATARDQMGLAAFLAVIQHVAGLIGATAHDRADHPPPHCTRAS
jgi:hypothetical protein